MGDRKETIVMFPFMEQGHLIPSMALALQLEGRGYHVLLVNTPLNIRKLRRSLPANSTVQLQEIPLDISSVPGLPPGVENTDVLPKPLIFPFAQAASASLKPGFRQFLVELTNSGEPPLCVIGDFFFPWFGEVAREFGIFNVMLIFVGCYGFACYLSIWLNLPHRRRSNNSGDFTLPDFPEAGRFNDSHLTPAAILASDFNNPCTDAHRENLRAMSECDGVLFNSYTEIDHVGLAYFKRILKNPVWLVGPIILQNQRSRAGKEPGISSEQCLNWLNSKPPGSVLYISFGSMNTISAPQMMELAKALLKTSERNFIWMVRPPIGFDIAGEFRAEEWLPEGFIRQVSGRGLIVEQWAPQVEILSHKSVGVFLSHCGWNSVLEALTLGVPVLAWPVASDQFYNSKLLEEMFGVCVVVARGDYSEVRSEDLAEKIELVMGETEKAKEMRRRASEMKKMTEDAIRDGGEGLKGSSVEAMDRFLDSALSAKKRKDGNIVVKMPRAI